MKRKGTLLTSRCSWLGQDTSSALRETGPSSTERTLSANFREHSVSLVFFSAGETCGQAESHPASCCTPPRTPPTLANMLVLGSEILLLTHWSQDSLVHLYQGQRLSQLDLLSPTALARGTAGKSCSR